MQPISQELMEEMNWCWYLYERRISTITRELENLRTDIRADQRYMDRKHAIGILGENDWKGAQITLKEYEEYVSSYIEDIHVLRKYLVSMHAELMTGLEEE